MKKLGLFFLLISMSLMVWSCDAPHASERVSVVATTTFIGDMVREIAGDRIDLYVLVGPGIDPHDYVPTQSDTRRLQSADLIVVNGLNLEERMGQVLASLGDETVLVLGDYLKAEDLIFDEDENALDPHIWFDLSLWSSLVPVVADRLGRLDPENATAYTQRAYRYVEDLRMLDAYVHTRIDALDPDQRILFTAHDAFAYWGRAYGFTVYAIQGVSTEGQASIADIRALAALMKEKQVTSVFFESTLPQETVLALIEAARAIGHEATVGGALFSDSTGTSDEGLDTLVRAMRYNLYTILSAIGD